MSAESSLFVSSSSAELLVVVVTVLVGVITTYYLLSLRRPKSITNITVTTDLQQQSYNKNENNNNNNNNTMKRLRITEASEDLTKVQMIVEENVPIPAPKYGQVLVKMAACPINASDYNVWKKRTGPVGKEGCGTVIASGGGIVANLLVGKKVGVFSTKHATCAEYVCFDAIREVFSFQQSVNLIDAASWFINPISVIGILDVSNQNIRLRKYNKCIINTGAASQLGQMLIKLAPQRGFTVVNVVYKQKHIELLQTIGAEYIVCTETTDWKVQLKNLIKALKIQIAWDAVGGTMTGDLLSLLPVRGICYVYGVLAGQPCSNIDPLDLIYREKQIKSFRIDRWLSEGGGPIMAGYRIISNTKSISSNVHRAGWARTEFIDCNIHNKNNIQETFQKLQKEGMTNKKLRVRMDLQ